jgi:hypothetical protein
MPEVKPMKRTLPSIAFALIASALVVNAQETTVKSKTKSSGGDAKKVTYVGCVQTGTQASTFVLDKVAPVSQTKTTDLTTGESSTTTTYALVPGQVEVQSHVGHKVEVTGMLIPAGDVKTETETKIDRKDAKDTKIKEHTEAKHAPAQFQVMSIKDLSETCR